MKNVVITGASRGIGFATAQKFLSNDWFVIGTSTSGNIDIKNENFLSVSLNYLKSESIPEAVDAIKNTDKIIRILVNNAGTGKDVIDDPLDIDILREDIEVNLIGPADFTNRLLTQLDSPSHIINMSSMGSSLCEPIEESWNVPAYKISKAGINMFTRTMGYQLKDKGITVSSFDPGWVRTDMGGEDALRDPEEVAEEIFDLANRKVETGQFWLNGKKRSW